jgi:hypothetical protein
LLTALSVAARGYYSAPAELLEVYGAYPLSNVDVPRIEGRGNRAWARLNGTERMRLAAVGRSNLPRAMAG